MKHLRKFNTPYLEWNDNSNIYNRIKENVKDILIDFKDRNFGVNVIGNREVLLIIIETRYGHRDGVLKELSEPINIIDDKEIFEMLFDYINTESEYKLDEIRYLDDSDSSRNNNSYTLTKDEQEYEYKKFVEVLKNKNLFKIILQFKHNSDL